MRRPAAHLASAGTLDLRSLSSQHRRFFGHISLCGMHARHAAARRLLPAVGWVHQTHTQRNTTRTRTHTRAAAAASYSSSAAASCTATCA